MTIYVASDHRGFDLKHIVIAYLRNKDHQVFDSGDDKLDPNDDFPVFASRAVTQLLSSHDTNARAILICGSGQGMVMAANRFRGIRAGLGWSRQATKNIRNDEDSNVLALPAELYDNDKKLVFNIIDDFLNTPFAGANRFKRRNRQLDDLV